MQKRVLHISYSIFILVFIQACTPEKSLPDLRETYSYRDVRPFGASVAYSIFKNAYPGRKIELTKKVFGENYGWDYDSASLYFNVSRNFYVSERDATALLDFAYKGNTVFISAGYIDTLLLEKIYCKQKSDRRFLYTGPPALKNTSLDFTTSLKLYTDTFRYFYYPFNNYFSELNGSYARKMGYNDSGKTNFFAFLWGKGRVYFHCEPRAFSNYFLLTGKNYKYMQEIMQMLPEAPENIYWDNFYGNKNFSENSNENFSTFSTLMKYPPLARAFLIALALLVLYIFFNSKRRQRIVPVIKPEENTSIAFAEAIAGLYLHKKDNRIIADKIITYFNEHLRTKYFMNINVQDENYAEILSRKSGVPLDITIPLKETIKKINAATKVNEQELLLLNGLTEKFLKNKI